MQRLQEYVKYTKAELDSHSETEGSCVYKINQNLHFAINAYILNDMNAALPAYILKNKVGYYDESLNGIILAVKNIKVLNGAAALRFDDPKLHININADCYVFRPEEGAILTGIAKHVGKHHVGIIIYGVFNASVRLEELVNKEEVKVNQEVKFKVKNFNIKITHPYIQGTLLNVKREKNTTEVIKSEVKKIIFKSDDEDSNDNINDVSINTPDSGIEEKESNDRDMELSELLSMIKNEPLSEPEQEIELKHNVNSIKRKRRSTESSDTKIPATKIKMEPGNLKQKNRKSAELSDHSDSHKEKNQTVKKKIKKEKID